MSENDDTIGDEPHDNNASPSQVTPKADDDDRKVIDILRSNPEELMSADDWFGQPEADGADAELSQDEAEMAERQARMQRACEAVNDDMVHQLEKHLTCYLAKTNPITPAFLAMTTQQLSDFQPIEFRDYREDMYDVDFVNGWMEQKVPQALLRDLHRPVWMFNLPMPDLLTVKDSLDVDEIISAALEVRQQLRQSQQTASQSVLELAKQWKEVLESNWEDSLPDDPVPLKERFIPVY